MEISFLKEECVDLNIGVSSAYFPKPPEDERWLDKKQEFEMDQEPGTETQSTNKDVHSSLLRCYKSSKQKKKTHKCPECHKLFDGPYKVRRHMLIHTDERPFQCPICNRGFRDTSHLNIHLKIHNKHLKQTTSLLKNNNVPSDQASKPRLTRSMCNRIDKTPSVSKPQPPQSDVSSRDEHESAPKDLLKRNPVVEISNFLKSDLKMIKGHWCPVCLKCFHSPSKLKRHIHVHAKEKLFKCSACSRAFQQKSELILHKCERTLKPKKRYKCEICFKMFVVPSKLTRHLRVHKEVKIYTCTVCRKSFRQACHLDEHLKTHTGKENKMREVLQENGTSDGSNTEKKYLKNSESVNRCVICMKIFPCPSKLYKHLLSHADVKPFKCDVCAKPFQNQLLLRWHQMIHKKSFPPAPTSSDLMCTRQLRKESMYQCKMCLKLFRKALNLSKHLEEHSRKRNNSLKLCEVPEEKSSEKQNCGLDDSNVSSPEILDSVSTQTDKMLEYNSMFNQHVHSTEKATVTLKIESNDTEESNNTSASSPASLTKGKSVNQCNICLKIFLYPSGLSKHLLSHTDKQFKCDVCLKSFRYPYYLRLHQKSHKKRVRPVSKSSDLTSAFQLKNKQIFQCDICLKSFRQVRYLRRHLKRHARKGINPFELSEVQQDNGVQSLTPRTLDATDESGLDGGNVSSPPIIESVDTQTDEMFESNNISNQDVPLTEMGSVTVKVEGSDTNAEEMLNDADASRPTNLSKSVNQCSICLRIFPYPCRLSSHLLTHTDIKPFKCNLCSKSFRFQSHLKDHMWIHKKPVPPESTSSNFMRKPQLKKKVGYQCEICWKIFIWPSKLKRHRRTHLRDKTYFCSICGESFKQACHRDEHLLLHTRERNGPSKLSEVLQENGGQSLTPGSLDGTTNCGLEGTNEILNSVNSQTDEILETNSKPYSNIPSITVEIEDNDTETHKSNDADTSRPTNLKTNVNQCSVCLKIFPYPSGLTRHLLTHTDIRPFKCNLCSKSFRFRASLQKHHVIHDKTLSPESMSSDFTRKRKVSGYQCEICWKMFISPSKLKRHLRVHLDINTYICTICGESFKQAFHLDEHLKLHSEETNGSSEFSELLQENEAQYSTPGTMDGANNYGLDGNSVPFSTLSESSDTIEMIERNSLLDQNVPSTEMASITVEINGNETNTDSDTEESTDTDTSRPTNLTKSVNQCHICLKTFKFPSRLRRHLLTHTDIKPFKCDVCSKSFRRLWHMQVHQLIHYKGQDIASGLKEQDYIGNSITSKDQDGADDFAAMCQDQNMLSQKLCGDSSDSGVFSSSSTSLLENVQVTSEVASQYSNKSVYGLTHNTDFSSLVEKKASDVVPFGRVSDCPPKTDSSLLHCASDSTTEENWTGHMDEIEDDCSIVDAVKHDHDYYTPLLCAYSQKPDAPDLRQDVVEGCSGFQETGGHFTQPPHDILVCPDCSQCFSTESELYTHTCANTHPEDDSRKSYQCDVCFKCFNAPSKLKRHFITHTGEKPFQCMLCEKSYTQSGTLKEHMLRHTSAQIEGFPQGLPEYDQANRVIL